MVTSAYKFTFNSIQVNLFDLKLQVTVIGEKEKFGTVMIVVEVVQLFMEVSTKPQLDLNRTVAAATFKIAVMLDFGVIGIQVMVLS